VYCIFRIYCVRILQCLAHSAQHWCPYKIFVQVREYSHICLSAWTAASQPLYKHSWGRQQHGLGLAWPDHASLLICCHPEWYFFCHPSTTQTHIATWLPAAGCIYKQCHKWVSFEQIIILQFHSAFS
jgi:hypothetical protein